MAKFFGAHVSASGGVDKAVARGDEIGAHAIALFVKNQKRWFSPPPTPEQSELFKRSIDLSSHIKGSRIVAHAGYLINLGNPTKEGQGKSLHSLCCEMDICRLLGVEYLNFHPGSSLGKISDKECLKQIANHMSTALERIPSVKLLLENTAGQGANVGWHFEQLGEIIGNINTNYLGRIGICLDTCHAFAAGYDLSSEEGRNKTFDQFDKLIGMDYLKAIHLNDSKGALGSRVDRHASLGAGAIGIDCFNYIAASPLFEEIPIILETPDPSIWQFEIEHLKRIAAG